MNEQQVDKSLEYALEQYFDGPSLRQEFLANLERSLLVNPPIPPHHPSAMGKRLTSSPTYIILALAMTLLAAFLLIGPERVLASIQGLLRYVPGFGLVEEHASIRILAEPVAQTREGVTLIVKQVVASTQGTSISFGISGLPPEALPAWTVDEKNRICAPTTELILPDGTRLKGEDRGSSASNNVFQYNDFFPSVPSEVNSLTWVLTCIPETLAGKASGNWETPLHLVPAPPNFSSLPVFEVSPSVGQQNPTQANTPGTVSDPLSLTRVIDTQDGYIFIGKFRQTLPAQVVNITPRILDGNGNLLGYTIPTDITLSHSIDDQIEWAYQVRQKDISWPITIQFDEVQVACSDSNAKLTFDTGLDPKIGQTWNVNQDFFTGPCKFRIDSIQRLSNGYLFQVAGAGNLDQLDPEIRGTTPKEISIRTSPKSNDLKVSVIYDQEPPNGVLTVSLSGYARWPGPWQVQWNGVGATSKK